MHRVDGRLSMMGASGKGSNAIRAVISPHLQVARQNSSQLRHACWTSHCLCVMDQLPATGLSNCVSQRIFSFMCLPKLQLGLPRDATSDGQAMLSIAWPVVRLPARSQQQQRWVRADKPCVLPRPPPKNAQDFSHTRTCAPKSPPKRRSLTLTGLVRLGWDCCAPSVDPFLCVFRRAAVPRAA